MKKILFMLMLIVASVCSSCSQEKCSLFSDNKLIVDTIFLDYSKMKIHAVDSCSLGSDNMGIKTGLKGQPLSTFRYAYSNYSLCHMCSSKESITLFKSRQSQLFKSRSQQYMRYYIVRQIWRRH